jgi:hypothetical protein
MSTLTPISSGVCWITSRRFEAKTSNATVSHTGKEFEGQMQFDAAGRTNNVGRVLYWRRNQRVKRRRRRDAPEVRFGPGECWGLFVWQIGTLRCEAD